MSDTPAPNQAPAPVTETQDQTKPANESPAQKEKRILEAKVNGKTIKVSEDDLLRDFSKYKSADEKFREAAEARKHVDSFLKQLKEDPEAVLSDPTLPIDRRKLAEKWLVSELEKELQPAKTKEQEELEELRKFKAEREKAELDEMTKKEQAEFQKVVEQRREALAKTFQEAIALSPLAKNEATSAEVVKEMATYMRLCKENGYEVSPQELAKHVENRFISSYQALVQDLDGPDLVTFLGDSIIKKLRKYDLSQLEASRKSSEPEVETKWEESRKEKKREFTDPRSLRQR